uniref:Uncharacterized protein n=1 Tax=Opuntia streptacantha TaxID=393608 RepID=A0A7C9AK34_OPUST
METIGSLSPKTYRLKQNSSAFHGSLSCHLGSSCWVPMGRSLLGGSLMRLIPVKSRRLQVNPTKRKIRKLIGRTRIMCTTRVISCRIIISDRRSLKGRSLWKLRVLSLLQRRNALIPQILVDL